MRTILLVIGAVEALIATVVIGRMVLHAYTHHGNLDLFHLGVTVLAASAGAALLWRAVISFSGQRPALRP